MASRHPVSLGHGAQEGGSSNEHLLRLLRLLRIVQSFPVELSNPRTPNPSNTITCDSTYAVTAQDGTIVHVEGTDTYARAGS